MIRPAIFSTLIGAALLFSASTASAQMSDGISVDGYAESSKQADVMRMSVTIEAQGSDLSSAMESLLEKKKKTTIKIEKLEPVEGSIKFDDVETGGGGDTSQMMQQMKRRFGNDPRMAKMMKVKPPVKLNLTLTADWKLETAESSELMLACDTLKQKISETDFAGQSEDKLSPEQSELAEEMAEMMNEYGGGDSSTPAGTPTFYYVRVVSAELQAELLGKAFDDAKEKATRLATATKSKLGKLKQLSSDESGSGSSGRYDEYYGYRQAPAMPAGEKHEDGSLESVSQSPDKASYSVSVSATFGIED